MGHPCEFTLKWWHLALYAMFQNKEPQINSTDMTLDEALILQDRGLIRRLVEPRRPAVAPGTYTRALLPPCKILPSPGRANRANKVDDTAYTSRDFNPWQGEVLVASRSKHCGELQQWTFRDVKPHGPVKICFWGCGPKWMNRNGDPVWQFRRPQRSKVRLEAAHQQRSN